MTSKEMLQILKKDGWVIVRIRGSHHQLKHPIKKGTVTVKHPDQDIPIKTYRRILQQAGLN